MTSIKTRLAGIGLALGLLALPLGGAAASVGDLQAKYGHHRYFFSEEVVWQVADGPVARYAMLEPTTLEAIAGRQHLDMNTIKFLEDNVWEREPLARPHGKADVVPQLLDQETILFIEGNFWDYPPMAGYADGGVDDGIARSPRCHGEGLVDPANQEIAGIHDGLVARYCSGPTYVTVIKSVNNRGTHGGVYGIDIGFFSNEHPWQDEDEPLAVTAGGADQGRMVLPYDAPQLRAEEPQ